MGKPCDVQVPIRPSDSAWSRQVREDLLADYLAMKNLRQKWPADTPLVPDPSALARHIRGMTENPYFSNGEKAAAVVDAIVNESFLGTPWWAAEAPDQLTAVFRVLAAEPFGLTVERLWGWFLEFWRRFPEGLPPGIETMTPPAGILGEKPPVTNLEGIETGRDGGIMKHARAFCRDNEDCIRLLERRIANSQRMATERINNRLLRVREDGVYHNVNANTLRNVLHDFKVELGRIYRTGKVTDRVSEMVAYIRRPHPEYDDPSSAVAPPVPPTLAQEIWQVPGTGGSPAAVVPRPVIRSHGAFRNVSRDEPCPVCQKTDWCSISADRSVVICRRVEGDGEPRYDSSGQEYHVHHLDDGRLDPADLPDIEPGCVPELATPENRDAVYRQLLGCLVLSGDHRTSLRHRGLNDAEITSRGYRTMPGPGRAQIARELVDRFGPDVCVGVPGLYIKEEGGKQWWSLAGSPGLLIPVRDINGNILAMKIRRDDPCDGSRYLSLSSSKHGGVGHGAQVHVPLHGDVETGRVRVTEGELKSDVATALDPRGLLTISIPGVSGWHAALPILERLGPAVVEVAFDMDAWTNPMVAQTLKRFVSALRSKGFNVGLNKWK